MLTRKALLENRIKRLQNEIKARQIELEYAGYSLAAYDKAKEHQLKAAESNNAFVKAKHLLDYKICSAGVYNPELYKELTLAQINRSLYLMCNPETSLAVYEADEKVHNIEEQLLKAYEEKLS